MNEKLFLIIGLCFGWILKEIHIEFIKWKKEKE